MEKQKSGLVTAGFVMAIIAILFSFIPIINNFSIILGILATIFGIVGIMKKVQKGMAITAVILGVLAVVISLSLQAEWVNNLNEIGDDLNDAFSEMDGSKTDELLADEIDVTIGEFEIVESDWMNETKLEVTIKNKSDETSSYSVSIEAVDTEGNRLDEGTIYVDDLKSGQSQKFDIFEFVSTEDEEEFKEAEFKVLKVSKY